MHSGPLSIALKIYFCKTLSFSGKAALETKSSADGKKGSLTLSNMIKWMELLDMDIEVIKAKKQGYKFDTLDNWLDNLYPNFGVVKHDKKTRHV